jgi:hypothetical protein
VVEKKSAKRCHCRDCGMNTTPMRGDPTGRWEYYMVTEAVWAAAGMRPATIKRYNETDGDFLCVGCFEKRLGRTLVPTDFADFPINEPSPWDTPRLGSRKAGRVPAQAVNDGLQLSLSGV